jgi:hypothetical protein
MRRVVPAARAETLRHLFHPTSFGKRRCTQSRASYVIDGLGGSLVTNPIALTLCPALHVETFDNQSLTLRRTNPQLAMGWDAIRGRFWRDHVRQVVLSNCEISGSAAGGLWAICLWVCNSTSFVVQQSSATYSKERLFLRRPTLDTASSA